MQFPDPFLFRLQPFSYPRPAPRQRHVVPKLQVAQKVSVKWHRNLVGGPSPSNVVNFGERSLVGLFKRQ
ncbi:hypothetical protein HPB50_022974 [Hyalomma asiaticum]|uniref:Uncharacterized protein n=1 Tax=Hyalomma asiaticum TaxID=266040 RepID=A0ACB7TMT1_HYAAI|nr:hypothetical protein HPB50_022974 [Hyalomma asiaticum]